MAEAPNATPVMLARRLQAALGAFPGTAAGADMSLLMFFLSVGYHRPVASPKLARLTGLARSSLSRLGAALGDTHWRTGADGTRRPGLGLVTTYPDPADPRRNIFDLTPEGVLALHRMTALIDVGDDGGE